MTLPVYLDAPPLHRPRLAYAIETLLYGIGLTPEWKADDPVLTVGLDPADAPVQIRLSARALEVFEQREKVEPGEVFWVALDGGEAPVLFGTPDAPDLLSSAFYWLSGWQEWATRRVDVHGRFPFDASLQHALNTAVLPAVDAYADHLGALLRAAGTDVPGRRWGASRWALCPTHDLDALRKWTPATLRYGLGAPGALASALWLGDPYLRGVEQLVEAEQARHIGATYFVKGDAAAPEDHAYRLDHDVLRTIYGAPRFEVGLHPSYHAFDRPDKLAEERKRLAKASGHSIGTLRHHYLRYTHRSPGLHQALGFSIDSSLGFATHEGFRRGTCRPFRVFDLVANRPTGVWEMPLALMDTTLFGYRKLNGSAAWHATEAVLAAAERWGGVCVALWHNNAFDASPAGTHMLRTLDHGLAARALVTSLSDALEAWQGSAA